MLFTSPVSGDNVMPDQHVMIYLRVSHMSVKN